MTSKKVLTSEVTFNPKVDLAVIGAGLVGLATALEFTKRVPGASLVVLEKEVKVAAHQSGHNSGVIHSGIYYKPGSLKAHLCLEGADQMVRFCKAHDIPYEICGKLIVATGEHELERLEGLYRRGQENGLRGLRLISSEEIPEREPYAAGLRALLVPSTGIVDYARVAEKMSELIQASGGSVCLSHEVLGMRRTRSGTVLETSHGTVEASLVVNCAGLQSDRVSQMSGSMRDLMIIPFRGEYYDLVPGKEHLLRGLLYPVPDPRFPFLGVHFTRRMAGGVEAGPNAVLALAREGYRKTSFRFEDVANYATFPGFWLMAAKHWQTSATELYRSWNKAAFVRDLQRLIPSITERDLQPGGSGVRAQALDRSGQLIDDFRFVHADGVLHVCNAPSPAATASLVIGRYIVDTLVAHHADKLDRSTWISGATV